MDRQIKKVEKTIEVDLGKLLKKKSFDAMVMIKEWYTVFKKECFYHGSRVLLEMEWKGKTQL